MEKRPTAEQFWDKEVSGAAVHISNWMGNPTVREYINASIGTPERPIWPMDWLAARVEGRRFNRALSIGCGAGALERDLIRRDLCVSVDAFDGSLASLAIARQEAQRAGMASRIRYFTADFNRPAFPRARYDFVLAHQAMHHVGKLEKLMRAVLHALTPDGLFYLDEYVGPSRHEWTEERYARQRSVFTMLPREGKFVDVLPFPVVPHDPSEAIRSNEILPQLAIGFEVIGFRGYGGNLLAPICPAIDWSVAPVTVLEQVIQAERELLRTGQPPFHALVLSRPKPALRKFWASWRYFTEPKLKRIAREIRKMFA